MISSKNILITGGTGSLGNALTKKYLKDESIKRIVIYSRCEFKQFVMQQEIEDKEDKIRYFIGDVRDQSRLKMAMKNVDIVIHTAALKQVPAIEYNPFEAIKTNVLGTMNIIESAIHNNVQKVLFISTDKAVNPINLYGASKMCAEKLILDANNYTGWKDTLFSCVRYGNVTGSRGSILPKFKSITNGVYPITDLEMTRFWMTLADACKVVDDALRLMKGGEIFIPEMKSYKITDMVNAINPEGIFDVVGIRKGEKLHEEMLNEDEKRNVAMIENYFVVDSKHDIEKIYIDEYSSKETEKMTVEEIREKIRGL
jgi:FlaA1/EpsC-like NDP-sugar epimerase